MNISGVISKSLAASTPTGKIGLGSNQRVNDKEEEKRNDLSSLTVLQKKGKDNEASVVDMLMKRKESMQKSIEGLQKSLSGIGEIKEKLPFEEIMVNENGKNVIKKVYSEEDLKTLKRLEGQEDYLAEKIKNLTDEMAGLDSEISAAMVMEQTRKMEKDKDKKEKELEKAAEKKIETKEEQERNEQLKQSEFFIQSDSIKKYVQSGRAIKARLGQELTRKENEIATDSLNTATQEQSVLHHKDPINEQPVPDTSFLSEQARIRDGKLTQSERRDGGEQLSDLKAAIDRTHQFILSQMEKLNDEAEELGEEKREDVRENEEKKPQDAVEKPERESSIHPS